MHDENTNKTVGERVREHRESYGISQRKLAKLVQEISGKKCTQQTIGNIESDSVKNSSALPYVALVLGVKLSELNPKLSDNISLITATDRGYRPLPLSIHTNNQSPTIPTKQNNKSIIATPIYDSLPPTQHELNTDIPVFGTIDLTDEGFIITDTPIDFIPRPSVVKLEKDAFAITIGVRTLEPALRIGNTIILHPRRLVQNGDLCLFFNKESNSYTIGESIESTGGDYIIKQYTPQQQKILPRQLWEKHAVIVANFF